jgi:hypothetical protein
LPPLLGILQWRHVIVGGSVAWEVELLRRHGVEATTRSGVQNGGSGGG